MIDPQEQSELDLHNMIALFAIAFELKYGTIDQGLMQLAEEGNASSDEDLDDRIGQLDEQIRQLKEQIAQMEKKLEALDELMPKLLSLIGSDSNAICPDSDPRRAEFFRVWNDPVIVIDDWLRLSQRFSEKEKGSFLERMMSIMQKYDLSQLNFSDLYPHSTL